MTVRCMGPFMSTDDRVGVKTYVPRYQKREWQSHAERLEMTQSEFVRVMVQAGRSKMTVPGVETNGQLPSDDVEPTNSADESLSNGSSDIDVASNPTQTDAVAHRDRVLRLLERNGPLEWSELLEALVDDVEADLDEALQTLQNDNLIQHSGREGGYVVIDDG